jgi:hypothetical protein
MGNVVDIHYGESASLPPDDQGRPICARIPAYYFHNKEKASCATCRVKNPKCRLRHECGYWFKLSDIKPNYHGGHYKNLLDTKTGLKLNFAVTLLYPLLVQEKPPLKKLFAHKKKFQLPIESGKTPWKDKSPVLEASTRIREQAINHFVRTNFLKSDDLYKAEFFLNRHLLDDAAMYLSHRYEKILNDFAVLNGDLERPPMSSTFLKLLKEKGRIKVDQYNLLRSANEVRNHIYHGRKTTTEKMLLDLLENLRSFKS